MQLTWLTGDMHCHCERHGLLDALVEGAAARLDFLALTNHPHKPIFAEQAGQIARARSLAPELPIFFGCEWNGIGGRHTNVIFPPSTREAEHAQAFLRAHDYVITGREPDLAAAFAQLRALPTAEQPVVFINHPSEGVGFTAAHLEALCAAAGDLFIGMEGLHGHQAWAHVLEANPADYPASRIGGLCDELAQRHPARPMALLAHSDFHIHKQEKTPDYPPGVFNHSCVGLLPGTPVTTRDQRTAAIFAALRAGRTCAVQGRWFDLHEMAIGNATLGGCADTQHASHLVLRASAQEPVGSLEIIGCLARNQPARLLQAWRNLPAGSVEIDWPVPAGAQGFLRIRVTAEQNTRPAIPGTAGPPPPDAPRLFLSAPLFLSAGAPHA